MDIKELKELVLVGNKELPKQNLVKFSWGNVSAIDREKGVMVIKPIGIPYDVMTVDDLSVVDMDGKVLEGPHSPSVDLEIHRAIYEYFPNVNSIVHTHSTYATVLAQLRKSVPCFGTTHADYFAGDVPCVGGLSKEDVEGDYEWNTGMAIVNYFKENGINPMEIPAALSPSHGTFAWGKDVWDAVHKTVVLEEVSKMAVHMYSINNDPEKLPDYMLERHYFRKHGAGAYFTNDDYGSGETVKR